jgi:hypothetical protein
MYKACDEFGGPTSNGMHLNPSAERSLAEGLEETLTVHRLHVPQQLRMTLASTNVIESAFAEAFQEGCC